MELENLVMISMFIIILLSEHGHVRIAVYIRLPVQVANVDDDRQDKKVQRIEDIEVERILAVVMLDYEQCIQR
jgi:cell division protein FtsB